MTPSRHALSSALGLPYCCGWRLSVGSAVPPVVKHGAEQQAEAQIGHKVSISKISFNPFTITLTASDITLHEPDKTTPAFSAKTLLVKALSASLFRLTPVLNEIQLVDPSLHIMRTSAERIGRYTFSNVIDRILATLKSEKAAMFSLFNIQLENGSVKCDDQVSNKPVDLV